MTTTAEREPLTIWTIYAKPVDYPDQFVARKFLVGPRTFLVGPPFIPTNDMFVAETIEELRALLPLGLTRLPRAPSDDRFIVESWL
jgi:hypothetical protein